MNIATQNRTWDQPHDVDSIAAVLPGSIVGTLLPPMSEIPEEFRERRSEWCVIAMRLFFSGGRFPQVKPGIDADKAGRHLMAVLGSFDPKHEHKEAGAGWLMSMWCETPNSTNTFSAEPLYPTFITETGNDRRQ